MPARSTQNHKSLSESGSDDAVIQRAKAILQARLHGRRIVSSSATVKSFLQLQSQGLHHEVFAAMFLDGQNRLIAYEQVFRGTLNETSVHPREFIRQALALNAAAVILHHNHPSGSCKPSAQDQGITNRLVVALGFVGIRVVDHVITSDEATLSMAECGWL